MHAAAMPNRMNWRSVRVDVMTGLGEWAVPDPDTKVLEHQYLRMRVLFTPAAKQRRAAQFFWPNSLR
jgi:hypothetical protein